MYFEQEDDHSHECICFLRGPFSDWRSRHVHIYIYIYIVLSLSLSIYIYIYEGAPPNGIRFLDISGSVENHMMLWLFLYLQAFYML